MKKLLSILILLFWTNFVHAQLTISAGTDKNITLPTSSVTMNATATGGTGTLYKHWTKISGPASSKITNTGLLTTTVTGLTAGVYQFKLRVSDNLVTKKDTVIVTVNGTVIPPPNQLPVAIAGPDIVTTSNMVTLLGGGTDAGGTIVAFLWTKISGDSVARVTTPNSAQTTVAGLVTSTYKFQLTVTDNSGATARDTMQVSVNPVVCNTAAPVTYVQSATGTGEIFLSTPNPAWKGGDTVKVIGNYPNGVEFDGAHGDPCRPLVIQINGNISGYCRFKKDNHYLRITGTGTGATYGAIVTGTSVAFDYNNHIEMDHFDISGGDIGIYCKSNPDTTQPITVFDSTRTDNYTLTKFHFHHIRIHGTHGEATYIGHTGPSGGQQGNDRNGNPLQPLRGDSLEVDHVIVDSADWDGIQTSNFGNGCSIHDCKVTNYGLINMGSQQDGIIAGGRQNTAIYNDTVINGTGNGLGIFGYGTINVHNCFFDSCGTGNGGDTSAHNGQATIFSNDNNTRPEIIPFQQVNYYNNSISHPQVFGAIRAQDDYFRSYPTTCSNNVFCIPGATTGWEDAYILLSTPGSTKSNNTLQSCPGGSPTPPTAHAGNNQTVNLPTSSTTLVGTGTDLDGTVVSYSWSKISGPGSQTFGSPSASTTTISGLQAGTYQIKLLVTDNDALTGVDTVQIVVNPISLPGTGQFLTTINRWNAYVHLPSSYGSGSATYPTIIFFPGTGETGTTASKVILNGPGAYITQGWNGNVTVGSLTEFIVISLQPPYNYATEDSVNVRIQTIKSLYRVDPLRLYLTGLSLGGWQASTFVTGDTYGCWSTSCPYAGQIAAIVTVEGVKPDDNPYPANIDNFSNSLGRWLCFEQLLDGRDGGTAINRMNNVTTGVPGSGIFVQTNYSGGGHCCWEQFYGGSGHTPNTFTLDGNTWNLYEWLSQQHK